VPAVPDLGLRPACQRPGKVHRGEYKVLHRVLCSQSITLNRLYSEYRSAHRQPSSQLVRFTWYPPALQSHAFPRLFLPHHLLHLYILFHFRRPAAPPPCPPRSRVLLLTPSSGLSCTSRARVAATKCNIWGCGGVGVRVADRSHCELQQCTVYQSGMEGLLCLGRSVVTCVGSTLVACGRSSSVMCAGAAARGASTLHLTSCRVVNASGHGVSLEEDSAAQLDRCRIVGAVVCGTNVTTAQRVQLLSTSISACSSHGVHCNGGGACDIVDCVVNGCIGQHPSAPPPTIPHSNIST
jgi:hypothetical protein